MIKFDSEKVRVFKYLSHRTDETDLARRVIFACAYLDLMWCRSDGLQDMERVGPWRLSRNTIAAEYMIGFRIEMAQSCKYPAYPSGMPQNRSGVGPIMIT
jgi:hypothetical protein